MNNSENTCEQAFHAFAGKDFADWQGLPGGCTLDEATAVFSQPKEGEGTAVIGSDYVQTFFRMYTVTGYQQGIKAWHRDGIVLKLDAELPDLKDEGQTLIDTYGAPAAKLDYYQGVALNSGGEWVYPERGMTLFLSGDGALLTKISVYAPTSLEQYQKQFYTFRRQRELD